MLVLVSLSDGPKHGYSIQSDIETFAGVRLGPGTLYGAILSPRTVSSHLYHAFPKLGVTSRAKLKDAIEGAGQASVTP